MILMCVYLCINIENNARITTKKKWQKVQINDNCAGSAAFAVAGEKNRKMGFLTAALIGLFFQ